jgi:hypothetical protein
MYVRLKAIWNWLKEANVVWLLVSVMGVALLGAFGAEANEARVRLTGWVLELFGLGTVAWGIRETRRQFGRPSILRIARDWVARYPMPSPIVPSRGITGTIGMVEEHDTAQAIGVVHTPSLEGRIIALENNLRSIGERVDHVELALDQEAHTRQAALSQERRSREAQNQLIRRQLEAVETGGLDISSVGLVWLALGLTLSTIPNELLYWLR